MGSGFSTNSLTLERNEGIQMTAILYQCMKCGKFKTKTIAGQWEINKLNKLTKAV